MNRSGFAPIVIILFVAAALALGGGVFYYQYRQTSPLLKRPAPASLQTERFSGVEVAAREVLVKFRLKSPEKIAEISQAEDIDRSEEVGGAGWVLLHSRSKDVATLMRELSARKDVLYVEPNHIVYLQ